MLEPRTMCLEELKRMRSADKAQNMSAMPPAAMPTPSSIERIRSPLSIRAPARHSLLEVVSTAGAAGSPNASPLRRAAPATSPDASTRTVSQRSVSFNSWSPHDRPQNQPQVSQGYPILRAPVHAPPPASSGARCRASPLATVVPIAGPGDSVSSTRDSGSSRCAGNALPRRRSWKAMPAKLGAVDEGWCQSSPAKAIGSRCRSFPAAPREAASQRRCVGVRTIPLDDLLRGDPWDGCADLANEDVVEWLSDFAQQRAGYVRDESRERFISSCLKRDCEDQLKCSGTPSLVSTRSSISTDRPSMWSSTSGEDGSEASVRRRIDVHRSLTTLSSLRSTSLEHMKEDQEIRSNNSDDSCEVESNHDWEEEFLVRCQVDDTASAGTGWGDHARRR